MGWALAHVDSTERGGQNSDMATEMEAIPKSYDEAVNMLARWHGENEAEGTPVTIFRFDDLGLPTEEGTVVRLLEVTNGVPETGEAWVVGFGPGPDFPFTSEVIILTPNEWEDVKTGHIEFPAAWASLKYRQIWPTPATSEGEWQGLPSSVKVPSR